MTWDVTSFADGSKLAAAKMRLIKGNFEVGSFELMNVSSGFQTTEVGSFGGVNASSGALLAVAPTTPIANEAYRDSIIKAWVKFNGSSVTSSNPVDLTGVDDSFNVSGVQDNGTGDYTMIWDTNLASANYACSLMDVSGFARLLVNQLAGSVDALTRNTSNTPTDRAGVQLVIIGDQ